MGLLNAVVPRDELLDAARAYAARIVANAPLAVQATKDAKNGQIIVARLGDDVTVKRFRRNKHLIELHAENPDYPTIIVEPGEPFEIEGLAVGLIRNTMLM